MGSSKSRGSRLRRPLRASVLKVALVLVCFACVAGCSSHDGVRDGHADGAVAEVGGARISSADVSYRVAVEKAYGNATATEAAVLVSLVNDALEREVARAAGVDATAEEIAALGKHADETSKAPEILAKVKRVFGDDRAAYERLYLAPKVVNRKLRAWYGRDAGIHARERELIEKAYRLVSSGMPLEQAAEECGLDFCTFEVGGSGGPRPAELARHFPRSAGGAKGPLESILDSLPVGAVHDRIVEDDGSFRVVRLIQRNEGNKGSEGNEKNGPQYKAEAIAARKRPFDEWFRERARKVEIRFLDAALANGVREKYPTLWWLKQVADGAGGEGRSADGSKGKAVDAAE